MQLLPQLLMYLLKQLNVSSILKYIPIFSDHNMVCLCENLINPHISESFMNYTFMVLILVVNSITVSCQLLSNLGASMHFPLQRFVM